MNTQRGVMRFEMRLIGLGVGAAAIVLGAVCSASGAGAPSIEIAPPAEALTFARAGDAIIAVTSYEGERIGGVDLTSLAAPGEDAIDLTNRLGYDKLKEAIERAERRVEVAASDLEVPVGLTSAHIAAGTNYREHAEEATVEGGPFLFAKLVTPTRSRAPIPSGKGLLDYEAELCLVAMKPIGANDPAAGGLMLCNDVTDRAVLLRNIDPSHPESGNGFTSGKSAPGYLPVGDLFVVPRDLKAFAAKITLQLSVNGVERQRAPVTHWIWDFDEQLRQARLRRDVTWNYWGGTARLPLTPEGAIPARTLVLAGTPAGTVFKGLHWSDYVLGVLDWLFGGWDKTVAHHVIERHIDGARSDGGYLKPGDVVSIRVDRLGTLANTVER
jgi:2,4-didehydro-3-deoxy-L-rhamnonate hydrolase